VAAVVFGPDRVLRHSRPRIGLVLGAGGVLGAAWMTGALVCLQDRLPVAAADVDLIVGTSAGSVLAAVLRRGASLDEIVEWHRGNTTGLFSESAALATHDSPLPPRPHLRPGSVPLAWAALTRPLDVPPWVAASGWLPAGRGRHIGLRLLIDALDQRYQGAFRSGLPSDWADGRTWIAAMDYDTGRHALFGRADAPRASLADAVVASCSIPGWYEPTVIGGRRYVDGGVRSMTSLSALNGTDVQEVYVLAPMASTEPDHPLQPHLRIERRLRQLITSAVIRRARALGAQGKRVTVVTPGPEDLAIMGVNLMDPRRRKAVLDVSFRTSAAALARLDTARPRAA
jgi:NTE family protein